MLNPIKKIIEKILPQPLRDRLIEIKDDIFDCHALKSYSQEGEDIILYSLFQNQTTGFYIDIGAHHPKRFSNTYLFYKKQWRGINIDAMPGSMKKFNKYRPRDINLEIPISDKKEVLTYYCFNEPALNGFSKKLSETRNGKGTYKIISTKKMETSRLEEILDEHLFRSNKIDFMSVDVEGLELNVLKSNNWNKYHPKIVLCEALNSDLKKIEETDIYKFMEQNGYSLYAKIINTLIFKSKMI